LLGIAVFKSEFHGLGTEIQGMQDFPLCKGMYLGKAIT
jgi:hypothetical protein